MKKKLSKAYKKLDIREYESIVAEAQGLFFSMRIYDYENEFIALADQYSEFEIIKHYVDGRFWGFNVLVRDDGVLRLIDTKDKRKHAEQLIKKLQEAVENKQAVFELEY